MRRRHLLALIGTAALWPRFGRAKTRLVAVLWLDTPHFLRSIDAALQEGFARKGLVEGQNLEIATRSANGDLARLRALASELAALKPDVIVTYGSGALAAHRAAPEVPIVAVLDADPVGQGVFQSYARPEAMVTGLTATNVQVGKNFEILRDLVPGLRGIGFMFAPGLGSIQLEPFAGAAAKALDLDYAAFPIRSMDEVKAAFSSGKVDGMYI